MYSLEPSIAISEIGKSLIKTFLYYDIFSYPLTANELYKRSQIPGVSHSELEEEVESLVQNGLVYNFNGYYTLQNNIEVIKRRLKGNERAKKYQKLANRLSKIIGSFPYVRAVMLSGSISKDYMDKNSDIDYFIIVEKNRVWFTRTLLTIFFKIFKLFIHDLKKYFCMNYFIDTEHLEIEEKNFYTATEIVTLIPTYGIAVYKSFLKANSWTNSYYPNYLENEDNQSFDRSYFTVIKKMFEKMFNNNLGFHTDTLLYNITDSHWKKKHFDFSKEELAIAIKFRKHIAKNHGLFHQKRILEAFEGKIRSFESTHNLILK